MQYQCVRRHYLMNQRVRYVGMPWKQNGCPIHCITKLLSQNIIIIVDARHTPHPFHLTKYCCIDGGICSEKNDD